METIGGVELVLVDFEPSLVRCWHEEFAAFPKVRLICDDILQVADTAVVSPANSYGFMDGDIDWAYVAYFGPQIELLVMGRIERLSRRCPAIGPSLVVPTGDARIPYPIGAPGRLLGGQRGRL
jgi:O-acetyl-ADP-ribose deacetylase (regulator of RNase III)